PPPPRPEWGFAGLAVIRPLLEALEAERDRLGLLNRAGVVAAAASGAPRSEWLRAHAAVFHYGAYDLTQHQLDWLVALGAAVATTVFFPGHAGSDRPGSTAGERSLDPSFRFAEPALSAIRQKASSERWVVQVRSGGARPEPVAIEAADPDEEFELIAEEIRRLAEREGVPPSSIVVVARSLGDPDGALRAAGSAFTRAGIPWETPQGTILSTLPAGRGLLALARAFAGEATPRVAVELLAQDWLDVFPPAARALSRASALAGRLPPFAGSADWTGLAAAGDPGYDRADIAVASGMSRGLARLEGLAGRFPARASWKEFVGLWIDSLESVCADRAPVEDVIEAGLEAVEELRALDPVEPDVTAAVFHARVLRALGHAALPLHDRAGGVGGGVRLLAAMDARGVRPRVLFLTGANDGLFPRISHEDPFLRDDARRALNDPLGYKIQTKRADGGAEERLLFRLLADAPTDRLYIIWHAADGRGRKVPPSPLVQTITGPIDSILKSARERAAELRSAAWESALGAADPARASLSADVVRLLDLPVLGDPAARDGFPAGSRPDRLRVTQLRDVAACPFKVHARAALGIEPPRSPRHWWEPEAWRLGNVIHAALHHGLERLVADPGIGGRAAAAVAVPGALAEEMPALGRLPVLRGAIERGLVGLVGPALDGEIRCLAELGLTPARYEERHEKSWVAGGLTLSFQADRLDRGAGGAHVTDYKSHGGRDRFPKTPKLDPGILQVSLYHELLAAGEAPLLSVLHLGLGMAPPVQPVRANGPAAVTLRDSALELASVLARSWRESRAVPWPDDALGRPAAWEPGCRYCDFRTACRSDHAPTLARLELCPELRVLRDALPATRTELAAAAAEADAAAEDDAASVGEGG
ncbi:MAG: PD-(D/E)XK nuclease family protein, partial [Candidatus Coatesbacteria bacterium]